ncbi:hypothetical protein SynBIOSE41_00054 [Synechococcus sp. BIOS-E4-1]|uniref:hypothetical protein n=1 Tax=Synechococcus sp. BIOS-E4-1 TaxID=1400864 RepID=UPI00164733CC|nr:hypothetical protein [Synechococcus sp. BIOS-E4-1]QNI52638.1 hypothetical protein SynBIOSE41_00054 [Synechococcus sp. BIOS-E4-1]
MAESQPLDSLRLALMQEVLPMGLAFVDRVRRDGPAKAVESVARGNDPLGDLRQQGEAAAREVRERLDQISPGLGNPVVSVQVEVDDPVEPQVRLESDQGDSLQLQDVLERIDGRLQRLDALMNKVS